MVERVSSADGFRVTISKTEKLTMFSSTLRCTTQEALLPITTLFQAIYPGPAFVHVFPGSLPSLSVGAIGARRCFITFAL